MITVNPGLNNLTQETYDSMVQRLDLLSIPCSCGLQGGFQFYGTYKRKIKKENTTVFLRIQRVRCTSCGVTHAIFPSDIIPYNQILLKDQIAIIRSYESGDGYLNLLNTNPVIDENNVAAIVRRYDKVWIKEMDGIMVRELTIHELVQNSFRQSNRQFLQIKGKINILVDIPT